MSERSDSATWNAPALWAAAVLLIVVSGAFRMPDLGRLSFQGDEELTAFAARSTAEQGAPELPGGLAYRRALPYTWLNAVAVGVGGADNEASYRFVGAAMASLTPAAVFLTAHPIVGPGAALLGATLLAVSEWHIAVSRTARMYGPFLLFYVLSGCWLLRWATTGKKGLALLGWSAFAVTASLQVIGIFALGFALIPLALGAAVVPATVLFASVALGATGAWLYDRLVVLAPYGALPPAPPFPGTEAAAEATAPLFSVPAAVAVLVGSALVLGVALVRRSTAGNSEGSAPKAGYNGKAIATTIRVLAGTSALALAAAGLIGAAATAAMCWALVLVDPLIDVLRKRWRWIAVGLVLTLGWTVFRVQELGFVAGAKELVRVPYPYLAVLGVQFPVAFGLAAVPVIKRMLRGGERWGVPVVALAVALPLAGVGLSTAWGPARYVLHVYPFALLLAGCGIQALLRPVMERYRGGNVAVYLAGVVVAFTGIVGHHGLGPALRSLRVSHGDALEPWIYQGARHTDHASAGAFVRDNLRPGDVVVAEDSQQMRWYAGRADYWLRSEADAWTFLLADADGTLRDIYIRAELLRTHADFDRVFTAHLDARVWIVTSGETFDSREYFLNTDQRDLLRWLDGTGAERFVAEDGVTRVFCVGCATSGD